MNVLQRIALSLIGVLAAPAMTADSPPAAPAPGVSLRSLAATLDGYVVMQVEYCLRNVPELSTELSMAHATYSQASARAVQILSQRYPRAEAVGSLRLDSNNPKAKEMQLRHIQSQGFRQCPGLVAYMHSATGESLATQLDSNYQNALRSYSRSQ